MENFLKGFYKIADIKQKILSGAEFIAKQKALAKKVPNIAVKKPVQRAADSGYAARLGASKLRLNPSRYIDKN